MTETWCPEEGDRIVCIDNSYRLPDKKYPGVWPKVGQVGVVKQIWKGEEPVIVILFGKNKVGAEIKEYFAVSRQPYLHYAPTEDTITKNR